MRARCDGVELVDVRQRPAQARDRMLAVDRLDLIEKGVDRGRQVGVHVQRQTARAAISVAMRRHCASCRGCGVGARG